MDWSLVTCIRDFTGQNAFNLRPDFSWTFPDGVLDHCRVAVNTKLMRTAMIALAQHKEAVLPTGVEDQ